MFRCGLYRGEFINSLSKLTNCDFIGVEPDKNLLPNITLEKLK